MTRFCRCLVGFLWIKQDKKIEKCDKNREIRRYNFIRVDIGFILIIRKSSGVSESSRNHQEFIKNSSRNHQEFIKINHHDYYTFPIPPLTSNDGCAPLGCSAQASRAPSGCTLRLCLYMCTRRLNASGHIEHLYTFSPVCMATCSCPHSMQITQITQQKSILIQFRFDRIAHTFV